MRNWTTTKSAPSSAACGSAVVENVPPHPLVRRIRSERPPTTSRRSSLGIEQDEVVDDDPVLQIAQAVDQFRRVRAPPADDGHLGPHAAQRNIRSCPSPLPTSRQCWPSTAAAPRPMSCSSHAPALSSAGPAAARATTSWSVSREPSMRSAHAMVAVLADAHLPDDARPICTTGVFCLAGIDLPVDEDTLGAAIGAQDWTARCHRAQRHVRRLARGYDVALGHRRGVRDRNELRRGRPRREDGPVPRAGRAVGRLRTRRRMARGACPRPGAACGRRQGGTRPCCANGSRPTSAKPTPRRCSPASIRGPSPTTACSNWPACSSTPRPRATPWPVRRPTPWPTRWWPSCGPRSSGSTCRTRSSRSSSAAACSTPVTPPSSTV